MSDAILVEAVSKTFRLPLDRAATLKYRVTHPRSTGRYRDFLALDDISFTVPHGQFLGIIGHNGSGKSTLLKILSRIYQADRGLVSVEGRVSPFLELGVGFNPELTARENVYLNGAVLGLTRRAMDKRVDAILDFAEVAEFSEQRLKNFSSGMQVRLAFSVAIQADAQVLLMDEVLAVGDARFAEKCFEVFASYKREGRTVVLVTHDLASVSTFCDRALLLDHGRLTADGSPTDVVARYRRNVGAQSDADATTLHAREVEAPDAQPPNRFGTREVAITGARLLRADGSEHRTFISGEPMVVEIAYEVHDDTVGPFIVGIAVHRADGLNVAGPNTRTSGHPLPCPPRGSRGHVRYVIEGLPLLASAYRLTVAIYDGNQAHAYDHIDDLLSFRVVDERGQLGIIDLGGHWESSVDGRALPIQLSEVSGAGAPTANIGVVSPDATGD